MLLSSSTALPAVTPIDDQVLMTAAVTEWSCGVMGESPYGDRLQQESHVGLGCLPSNDGDSRSSQIGVSGVRFVLRRS